MAFWAENHCACLKNVAGLPQLDAGVTTSSRHMFGRRCSKTWGVWQNPGRSQPFAVSGRGAAGGDFSGGEGPLHCLGCRDRSMLCLLCWRGIQKSVWHHGGTCWCATSLEPSRVWEMLDGDWSWRSYLSSFLFCYCLWVCLEGTVSHGWDGTPSQDGLHHPSEREWVGDGGFWCSCK